MYIAEVDKGLGEDEWRPFVEAQGFGHFAAAGRGRDVPVVLPTQFVLDRDEVILHVVAKNPILDALSEQPRALLSVAGDWAFIPSDWKAIGDEDPLLGIPTTYYAAVQLEGTATVHSEPEKIAQVLRRQLGVIEPGVPVADPLEAHGNRLKTIRAVTLAVDSVRSKFKYGGNVDFAHRAAVISRLEQRRGPGDIAAARHTERRMEAASGSPRT
jgi:transcriptional regulator